MSTVKTNNVQLGQSVTATNNFTWYQPASPDGTVRLGNGNSGSVTDLITVGSTGNLTFANSISLSAASTKTLTLNGGAGSNGLVLTTANAVGIGTASPLGNLSISATNPLFAITNGNSVSYSIASFASDNTLRIAKYGVADFAVFDSSGNLGLGVTPSTSWQSTRRVFQIGGAGAVWAATSGAGTLFLSNNTYYDGTNFRYINTSGASYIAQQTDGSFSFNRASSDTAGNAITFTQAMLLDPSGNLGIGQTSVVNRLDVLSSGSYSAVVDMTTAQMRLKHSTFPVQLYAGLDHVNRFAYMQASETGVGYRDLMLQPAGGNLLVGTTSTNGSTSNTTNIVGGTFASLKTSFAPITASTNYDWTGIPLGNYILSIRSAGTYHRTLVAAITAYDSADNSVTILTQSGYGAGITLSLVSVAGSTFTIRASFANNMDSTNLSLIRLQ